MDDPEKDFYKKKLLLSMIIPGIFLFVIWIIKIIEVLFDLDLSHAGIYPLRAEGLPGILLSPFIHEDFSHLFNNSLPLFFLGMALFYFYPEIALKVLAQTWLITGLMVWLAGRPAWHIGVSGIIYGLTSFLFFGGIIRKNLRLSALSLLIVFLYGSMIWGIFPGVYKKNISWESHMFGFVSGILLAIVYRNEGPREPVHLWVEEDDEDEDDEETEGLTEEETERLRD